MSRPPEEVKQELSLRTDSQTEDYWAFARKEAKSSLYTFCRGVVGHKDMVPHFHLEACNFLQQFPWNGGPPESRMKMLKIAREHLKSSMASVGMPPWLLVHDPDTTILMCSARRRNTRKWLKAGKEVIEKPFFQWLFPEVKPDRGNWSKDDCSVVRSADAILSGTPSITATSMDSGQASGHYKHIIDDDLIDEKSAKSPTLVWEARERFKLHDALMDDWVNSTLTLVGTPWGFADVLEYAEEFLVGPGRMMKMERSCYKEDGTPVWPERHPDFKLKQLEETWGPILFALQWLVSTKKPKGEGFPIEMLKYYRKQSDFSLKCDCPAHASHVHKLSEMVVICTVDPAFSDSEDNAETAIVVSALAPCDCRFVLDTWAGHVDTEETYELIIKTVLKYVPFIQGLGIEAVAGSRIYKGWLEHSRRRGLDLGNIQIVDLKPDTSIKKEVRIRGQALPMSEGLWHITAGMPKFLKQVGQFPRVRPIDLLDAWAWSDECWRQIGADPAAVHSDGIYTGPDLNNLQELLDQGAIMMPNSGYN